MLVDLEFQKKADCPQSELPPKRPETMCCTEMFLQCKFNERFLEEKIFFSPSSMKALVCSEVSSSAA